MTSNYKLSMAEIERLNNEAQEKIEKMLLENELGLVTGEDVVKEIERLLSDINEKIYNAWE